MFITPRNIPLEVGDYVETMSSEPGRVIRRKGRTVSVRMLRAGGEVKRFTEGDLRYVPRPRDIVRRAVLVQMGWDRETERKRRAVRNPEFEIPLWEANEFESSMIA